MADPAAKGATSPTQRPMSQEQCWAVKGCPASFYFSCAAFKRKTSCWDLETPGQGCLCKVTAGLNCEDCSLFQKALRV